MHAAITCCCCGGCLCTVFCCCQLLLLEVDEAEELAQEEHVAVWTSQDAAQAAHLGPHAHLNNSTSAGEHEGESDAAHEGGVTDAASVVGSVASTAAAALQELGPSVSGVLSTASLNHADEASHEHDSGSGVGHEHAADAAPSRTSQGGSDSSAHKQTPAAAAAAAGAQLQAAIAAVAAAEARLGSLSSPLPSPAALAPAVRAAVAVRGLEDSERVPSSPSLASWRRSPDEVAMQDQEGSSKAGNDSPYVTITGAFNDQGYDPEAGADSAAAAGVGSRPGGSQGASPKKGGKLAHLSSNSSSISSRLRDAASDVAAAAVAPVTTAVENGQAAAAAVVGATQKAAADASEQQQVEGEAADDAEQERKQPGQSWVQSYASWATDKASETWQSQPVQVCTACEAQVSARFALCPTVLHAHPCCSNTDL